MRLVRRTSDRLAEGTSQDLAGEFPDISPERFQESVVLVQPDGERVFGGRAALLAIGLVRGLGFVPTLAARIPGGMWLVEIVYAWVARNRMTLSRIERKPSGPAADK